MNLHANLRAQQVRAQTERLQNIERTQWLLDEADALVQCGMILEACAVTGKAREAAVKAGLI